MMVTRSLTTVVAEVEDVCCGGRGLESRMQSKAPSAEPPATGAPGLNRVNAKNTAHIDAGTWISLTVVLNRICRVPHELGEITTAVESIRPQPDAHNFASHGLVVRSAWSRAQHQNLQMVLSDTTRFPRGSPTSQSCPDI